MLSTLIQNTISTSLDDYQKQVKTIKSNSPVPYGTIPKRTKRQQPKASVPTTTEKKDDRSIFTILYDFLFAPAEPTKLPPLLRTGLLPTTPPKADVAMSPLEVVAPISYKSSSTLTDDEDDQPCPPLSTSSSSTSSWSSTESLDMLSDILRDHYTQSHSVPPSMTPLEMYCLFESNPDSENLGKNQVCNQQTPVDDCLLPPTEKLVPHVDAGEAESIIRMDREVRANPAYWRIIVAEMNMMRANKIVCPLRPRGSLPKRSDSFLVRQSPLRKEVL